MSSKTTILVAGPTAVGKSDTAIFIAQILGTEIVSADSRQCFKEMTIGTAVPDHSDLMKVKHHFIQSHSIRDDMSAGVFTRYVSPIIDALIDKNNSAVICGGTGLYIQALLKGMDEIPAVDREYIDQAQAVFDAEGITGLANAIATHDPLYKEMGNMENPSRMMRALSFVLQHGHSIETYRTNSVQRSEDHVLKIGLELDRSELYDRINSRVDKMIVSGLMEELERLYPHREHRNLRTVGYQEFYSWGHWPLTSDELQESIEKVKQNSRRYAKRQMTWFKNKEQLSWFHPEDRQGIESFVVKEMNL